VLIASQTIFENGCFCSNCSSRRVFNFSAIVSFRFNHVRKIPVPSTRMPFLMAVMIFFQRLSAADSIPSAFRTLAIPSTTKARET
jgi:hypothetical protein